MNRSLLFVLGLALATSAAAQPDEAPTPPVLPAFDLDALAPSANACEDFYQYACGGWHANNPMPPDASFWARPYRQFAREVDDYLRILIEEAAQGGADRTPDEQKIGDYYAACMDTSAIERRGLGPLRPELSLIDGMDSIAELPTVLGTLQRTIPTAPDHGESLLYLSALGDPVEGGQAMRIWISPFGIGLGEREHYLTTDAESLRLRTQYTAHVAQMLRLVGETEAEADRHADAILALETTLAEALLPNSVLRNDATARSNPVTPDELHALTPHFRWADFFSAHGLPEDERFNAQQPAYFQALDSLLRDVSLDTWKAYLRWHLVAERAHLLPAAFRQARFAFYGQTLQGKEAPLDRAQACVDYLERDLPEVLSRLFVERAFRPEMRTQTLTLFEEIKATLRSRIERAAWMAPETKQEAFAKLDAVRISVGHPDTWPDDPLVVIRRDDFYGNVQRTGTALRRVAFEGLGQPATLNRWWRPPTAVVGYQEESYNAIFLATAILLSLDNPTGDPAVLYGGLGALLAHELLHGFDSLGRSYDAQGRLRDWWTPSDAARFEDRAQCVADQFSAFEYAPGIPVDGAYVVSETVAELSAMSIAWEAYQRAIAGQQPPDVEGVTSPQRFFLTNAQTWCTEATDANWRSIATGDSHAWGRPAVHGTVLNLPAFGEAFGCRAGQAMVKPPEQVCKVW